MGNESFDATYAYIKLLDSNPSGITSGLGDWMPVEGTSVAFTGRGFQMMSYLAFANITEILGKEDLAKEYRQKAEIIRNDLNQKFLTALLAATRCTTAAMAPPSVARAWPCSWTLFQRRIVRAP